MYHVKKQEVKYDGLVVRKERKERLLQRKYLKGLFSPYEKKYWEVGVDTLMGFTDVLTIREESIGK